MKIIIFIFFLIISAIIISLYMWKADFQKGLRIYDTNGSSNQAFWVNITSKDYMPSSPQNIVIQNGYIRILYEKERIFKEQRGSHAWYFAKSGTYIKATDTSYGDYTYFLSTVLAPPNEVKIIDISDKKLVIDFVYTDHFVKDNFKIGDIEIPSGPRPFVKRIEMHNGIYGAFVKLISIPSNPNGEREFSLGQGNKIFFGVAQNFISDLFSYDEITHTKLPPSNFYLGFTNFSENYQKSPEFKIVDEKNNFYYFVMPPKEFIFLMYKFSKSSFGGPIVQYFKESKQNKGMFVGIIPYDNPFYMEAEYSLFSNAKILYYEKNVRNGKSLELNSLSKLQILPPKGLSPGAYRIILRAKAKNAKVKLLHNEVEISIQKILSNSSSYTELPLDITFNSTSNADRLSMELLNGSLIIDAIYYIPITSDNGLFPDDIANQVIMMSNH